MEVLLSIRDVSMVFGHGPASVTAVNHISLEVRSDEVILILGPSGSGKTTLLSIMGGLLRPTSGAVYVENQALDQLSDEALSALRCKKIGYVFQSFNLLEFLTVRKNVEVMLNLGGVGGRRAREHAAELLGQVNLNHRLEFFPNTLSGGERQRVSIARALANNPRIILADEPTGNLDSVAGHSVAAILSGLARQQGCGVVIVTHDSRICDIADRVLHIVDGSLVDGMLVDGPYEKAAA